MSAQFDPPEGASRPIDEILKEIEGTLGVHYAAEIRLGRPVSTAEDVLSYMLFWVEWTIGNLRTGNCTRENGGLIYARACEQCCRFVHELLAAGVRPSDIDWAACS
jgi:hypothetical protein